MLRDNDVREPPREPPLWRGRRARLEFAFDGSDAARGLLVLAESARAQYESLGLEIVELAGAAAAGVRLLSPEGDLVRSWNGYAPAAEVLYTVRRHYGEPRPRQED